MIELQQYHNKKPVFINEQYIACIEEKEAFTLITMANGKNIRVTESVAEISSDIKVNQTINEQLIALSSAFSGNVQAE